jgi:hypothetical protein
MSSGPVARNGLSLAHNDSRLRETHSGVKGPGLLLRSLLPGSPDESIYSGSKETRLVAILNERQ